MKGKTVIFQWLLILIFSCITHETVKTDELATSIREEQQNALVLFAESLVGRKTYSTAEIKGKQFTLDCIGTVCAIYWDRGVDIQSYFKNYEGNGVSRLYQYLADQQQIHKKSLPDIGDVIFWDHTYDKNNDGIPGNDPLTHAGIVLKVEEDHTVYFIHANYTRGIVIETMNLQEPDIYKNQNGKIINSHLFLGSKDSPNPQKYLTGSLFNSYGRVLP